MCDATLFKRKNTTTYLKNISKISVGWIIVSLDTHSARKVFDNVRWFGSLVTHYLKVKACLISLEVNQKVFQIISNPIKIGKSRF